MMLAWVACPSRAAPFVGRTRAHGVRADRAVRELPDLQLRDAVAGHRRTQATVVLHLDSRAPADGRGQRLAVGRGPGRGRPRPLRRSASSASPRATSGGVANVGWLPAPSLPAGIAGPFTRQLADRAGIAIAWGLGHRPVRRPDRRLGRGVQRHASRRCPRSRRSSTAIYPGLDLTQPSALLQLTFFSFGSFILGLAGATFLAGWASDEGRRRLEVVLSTPRRAAELGGPERTRGPRRDRRS